MILRRNYAESASDLPSRPAPDSNAQEYELLLEFDLKREREKNMILEERLKNKETFIQQMKHFQEELTIAYEQCKNELILAQEKIQYLQNVEFREYTEQIADLKHMLLVKNQQTKRHSISRQDKPSFTAYNSKIVKNKSQKSINQKHSDRRESKTSSHYATHREKSPSDRLEQDVAKELRKSANFLGHFLQMTECYLSQLKGEPRLTKKLKKSWKWIKQVVREWDNQKQTIKQAEQFKKVATDLLNVDIQSDWSYILNQLKQHLLKDK